MKADQFVTSDGQKIDLVPGWFENKNEWPYGIKDFNEFVEKVFGGTTNSYPKSYEFFVNKLVVFNHFREILSETLLRREKWPRALDIGTGPAIHPRLVKASGMCDEAWGIDLWDRRNEFSDDEAREYLANISALSVSDDKKPLEDLADTVELFNSRMGNCYPLPVTRAVFDPHRSWKLDRFIVDDFMTWDAGTEKFDLVTAMMCIERFETRALFNKVHSLLNKDGVFFAVVTNWHDLYGGSMNLPMDAPWLHSQLNRDDLLRYYREMRPEIADAAEKCINFGNSHMTPFDYDDAARESRMKMLTYRRSLFHSRGRIRSLTMNQSGFFRYFFGIALPHARRINPYFSAPDAFTDYFTMVFIKE